MLENITKVITRFFGIIAGSLSGISAILIAIGFLAERSHLKMLGFTTIPVDVNQYLYTGASLIGFLPGIIILQTISLLTKPIPLVLLTVFILIRISLRFQKMNKIWSRILSTAHDTIARFKTTFLILFLFVQILTLGWMIRAISIENLLFSEIEPTEQTEFSFLTIDEDNLKQLLISEEESAENEVRRYFTQLLLITVVVGLILRYLTFLGRENGKLTIPFHMRFWLVINFLLFATQVFLLPGNYGVLILNNKYQEVKVKFVSNTKDESTGEKEIDWAGKSKSGENKNKIRDQQLELAGTPFVCDLDAFPKLFFVSGDGGLNYSVETVNPNIVQLEIENNILIASPVQKGETQVTITAGNSEGVLQKSSFKITVVDEINKMGAQEANPVPTQTLVVGERSFVKDLNTNPPVFDLLDSEPVHLSYRVNSSSPEVASVDIDENILTVKPVSKGSSQIIISANDGYGRMINSMFEVSVLGQTLEWPVDERLLLLYQDNDVFYLYSKTEKRIWHVRSNDIESMVFYGLVGVFKFK